VVLNDHVNDPGPVTAWVLSCIQLGMYQWLDDIETFQDVGGLDPDYNDGDYRDCMTLMFMQAIERFDCPGLRAASVMSTTTIHHVCSAIGATKAISRSVITSEIATPGLSTRIAATITRISTQPLLKLI
jgi:hypothetical protein